MAGGKGDGTYIVNERKAPALVLPRGFCNAFKSNEEFALKIEKFIEIGEEEVDGVLIHEIAEGEGVGVFLRGDESWNGKGLGMEYLHDLEILNVLAFCLDHFADDVIPYGLFGVCGLGEVVCGEVVKGDGGGDRGR